MIPALIAAGTLQQDVTLAPLTTYKFGGPATWYSEPSSVDELSAVVAAAAELDLPVVPIGRGSNVVISGEGLDAVVIRLRGVFSSITVDDLGVVVAGSSVPLPKIARFAAEHDRIGLEFFVGIPGSAGGAVRMNAGCFGSETKDWMIDATVLHVPTITTRSASSSDLDMQYRHSALTPDDIVLDVRLRTDAGSGDDSRAEMRRITQWRRDNQPGGTLNAGSAFKNPPGDSAGRLIDSLGLKGQRVGGASVSMRHANFFEADPTTSPQDVYDLIHSVRGTVHKETGIYLEPEMVFMGAFNEGRTLAAEPDVASERSVGEKNT